MFSLDSSIGKAKPTSVDPTSQGATCAANLKPPTEVPQTSESLSTQTLEISSKEIIVVEQSTPLMLSMESPLPNVCSSSSPIKDLDSPESTEKYRNYRRKKRRRSSSSDTRRHRREGKENQEESKKLRESDDNDGQNLLLRDCREMIDSLRIGRFSVKDQYCYEDKETESIVSKENNGSNSPLAQNLVHFSYTNNLKQKSTVKVKDVSTNTTSPLCLDVSTNTDTSLVSFKDCMLQTNLECPQCTEKKVSLHLKSAFSLYIEAFLLIFIGLLFFSINFRI